MNIIKRNGFVEKYDNEKVSGVLRVAGLEEEKMKILVKDLDLWINSLKADQIKSTELRDQILIELHKLDDYVEGLFRWYEKTKDLK